MAGQTQDPARAGARGRSRPCRRGFTLIELLVAVGISVVLITMVTYIFGVATSAVRLASAKAELTERRRALNIRLRSEIAAMLPKIRAGQDNNKVFTFFISKPAADNTASSSGDASSSFEADEPPVYFAFAATTTEGGKQLNADVAYLFLPNGKKVTEGKLVRLRDATVSEVGDDSNLGDDAWIGYGWVPDKGYKLTDFIRDQTLIYESDVMLTNVREVSFTVLDPPLTMNGKDDDQNGVVDDLQDAAASGESRLLPRGVKVRITYGAEPGRDDNTETVEMYFPVERTQ